MWVLPPPTPSPSHQSYSYWLFNLLFLYSFAHSQCWWRLSSVWWSVWVLPAVHRRLSWYDNWWIYSFTITVHLWWEFLYVVPFKIVLFVLLCSWSGETEQATDRHRHQLGWWSPSRQEVWSLWFLLRQRHRPGHLGAAQVYRCCFVITRGSLPFWAHCWCVTHFCPGTIRGYYTLTSTSTMVMEWRRPSTPQTESWLSLFTSMVNTSQEPETWGCVFLSALMILAFSHTSVGSGLMNPLCAGHRGWQGQILCCELPT